MALDLKDDPKGIAQYIEHHRKIWPEVRDSLLRVGVLRLEIFRLERRLVMLLDTKDSFDRKRSFAAHTASDPRCAEWEALMKTFQEPPPGARPGQLWTDMKRVFRLERKRSPLRPARKASNRRAKR